MRSIFCGESAQFEKAADFEDPGREVEHVPVVFGGAPVRGVLMMPVVVALPVG